MSQCPVCGKAGLAAGLSECPQCNADLECFVLLEALSEGSEAPSHAPGDSKLSAELADIKATLGGLGSAATAAESRWGRPHTVILAAIIVALAFTGALILYQGRALEGWLEGRIQALEQRIPASGRWPDPGGYADLATGVKDLGLQLEGRLSAMTAGRQSNRDGFAAAVKQLSGLTERIGMLEGRLAKAEPPAGIAEIGASSASGREPGFLLHQTQPGETLWSVAKRYYPNGSYYPILLEHNPGLGVYYDRNYGNIRILADRNQAQALFQRLVFKRDGRWFYRYRIREGEDWDTLSAYFYGHGDKAGEIMAWNANQPLTPGERVVIPLNQ